MYEKLDYWEEAVAISLEESAGITLTPEQLTAVAKDMENSHDNIGMAFYSPPSDSLPYKRELEEAKEALRKEKSKVTCRECNGTGSQTTYGGTFESTSQCWKCHGAGRHLL